MRILLVDDEARMLDSMRRSLAVERPRWEVVTATTGADALRLLEPGAFQVLVTDMQMPELDGAAVLREAKALAPGTVRILLSGHAGRERILACEGCFHQFLGKPVHPDGFLAVLDAFDQDHALPATLRARSLVAGLDRLPSLPRIHQELVRHLEAAAPGPGALAHLVRQDLGLASRVLKLVNSPYLAADRKITDLTQATELLSLDLLRAAVLPQGPAGQHRALAPAGLSLENLWAHSTEVALAARTLAFASGQRSEVAEACYTAGLLHDIGKVVLALEPDFRYHEVLARHGALEGALFELERDRFGTDHAELGAELLHLWGVEGGICQAIRHHHQGTGTLEPFSVGFAVHFADAWSSRFASNYPFADGSLNPAATQGEHAGTLERWSNLLDMADRHGRLSPLHSESV
jgi:putative nucleotidyltransferase with HDIG domain